MTPEDARKQALYKAWDAAKELSHDELMSAFVSQEIDLDKQTAQITTLEAQVASLKDLAIEERSCRLSLPQYGCIASEEEYRATDPENALLKAREQLDAEHEAMRQ